MGGIPLGGGGLGTQNAEPYIYICVYVYACARHTAYDDYVNVGYYIPPVNVLAPNIATGPHATPCKYLKKDRQNQ